MDMSKLPKLSQTPKPPSNEPPAGEPEPLSYGPQIGTPEASIAGMLWISLVIGALCMFWGRGAASYFFAKLTGREHHTHVNWVAGPNAGQEVGYWDLQGAVAWTDTGVFLFGLAMVLEGIALAVLNSKMGGKKIWLSASLGVVVIATIVNLVTAVKVLNVGATPLTSGLAVAFGGYMAMYQWKLLRMLSTGRAAPMT